MPPNAETIELVKAAQKGEQDAFAALFGQYHPPVLGYVYHTVHDRAAAEDVTQDAFIRAHQSLASLGPPFDFKSWIFRIAGNLAIDYLRAGKRFVDAEDDVLDVMQGEPSTSRPHEKRLRLQESTHLVWGSLEKMPPHYRQALIMKEFSELSYGEMANAMEVTYDNARQLVHRARTMFREIHGLRAAVERAAERCGKLGALLSAYQDGELPSHEMQPVQEHLAGCQDCRAEQEELKKVGAILAALAPLPATPAWIAETLDKLRAPKPAPAAAGSQAVSSSSSPADPGVPPPSPAGPGPDLAGASAGGMSQPLLFALGAGGLALVLLLIVGTLQVAASLGLIGNGGQGPAEAPLVPTAGLAGQPPAVASATMTITATHTPTPTGTSTPSLTVTASPTVAPPEVEATGNSNCRAGPSNQYPVTGILLTGERAPVDGKNAAETWWWIDNPSASGHCYVWDGLVEKSGDFSQVPVVPDPPTPTPDSPPSVSISHSPTGPNRPRSNETVSFSATASDDIGVAALEIWIDSPASGGFSMVQSCSNATTCTYIGGPYPAGQLSYYARATDTGGNSTTSSTTTITIFGPAQ